MRHQPPGDSICYRLTTQSIFSAKTNVDFTKPYHENSKHCRIGTWIVTRLLADLVDPHKTPPRELLTSPFVRHAVPFCRFPPMLGLGLILLAELPFASPAPSSSTLMPLGRRRLLFVTLGLVFALAT